MLAADLQLRHAELGQVVFAAEQPPQGVWIVRSGLLELAVGAGRRRLVVQLLRPGDVEGNIQLLQTCAALHRPGDGGQRLAVSFGGFI